MKKLLLVFTIFSTLLFANIGSVTIVEGEVFATREGKQIRLNLADKIEKNDFIETKINSKIKITFIDNTMITIGKESNLKIEDYFFDQNNKNGSKTELNITKGTFHTITGQIGKVNPSKFKLKTKNATIGIRGTEIYGDQDRVFCTQGAIFVESFGNIREVSQGFFINTFDNAVPSQAIPIDTEQFQDINSNLNTNNFNNSSTPLNLNNQDNQDNQNSWGYWAAPIQDERNIAKIDEDIAKKSEESNSGLQLTDANYIKEQINSSQSQLLSFYGSFSGDKVTNSGHINLNFNIGSGNNDITGEYSFGYEMIQHYGSFANGNIYEDPRNGQMYFETMSSSDARAEGQFYGDTMNSISGTLNNFDINNPDASVNFNAKR